MNFLARLFSKVTYSCTVCDAVQRIPLRRVHFPLCQHRVRRCSHQN